MKFPKRKPSPQTARQAADPNLLWIVGPRVRHDRIDSICILAVRTGEGTPEIIETVDLDGPDCMAKAVAKYEAAPAARTILSLPGSDVICRLLSMPAGTPDQLEMALRLQIENLLIGGSARWRTEGALLPLVDPEAPRPALVVEWPANRNPEAALAPLLSLGRVAFAPEAVGLTALVSGAIGMGKPESLALDLDRERGCISLAYSNGVKTAVRVVREDGSDAEAWRRAALGAVHETLLLADLPEPETAAAMARVEAALPESGNGFISPLAKGSEMARALVRGAPADDAWWSAHAALAGLAAALSGPLGKLCGLQANETAEDPGFVKRLLNAGSKPRSAVRAAVAALLLIALLPPALAGARLLYLQWLLPEPESFARILDRDDTQVAMYRDYERYAWPMTKLLGDVASTTPEGIELKTIVLSQGTTIAMNGSAKPRGSGGGATDAILQMEQQMRSSGVFDRVEKTWDPPNANGVIEFALSAAIIKPSLVPNYPDDQDFAKRTLRDRRYGVSTEAETNQPAPTVDPNSIAEESSEAPTETSVLTPTAAETAAGGPASGAAPAAPVAAADPRSKRRPPSSSGASSGDIARRGRPGAEDPPPSVPEPLTDEQITAMTQTEAREAATRVSTARGLSGLDEATEARLKAEFYKLLERARKP